MKMHMLAATAALGLFACGGDGDDIVEIDAPLAIDAHPPDCSAVCSNDAAIDALPSTVHVVTCPAVGEIASEVTTPGFNYAITDASIETGDIVRFTMTSFHNAMSGEAGTPDGNFDVDFGATVCLQFTAPGTFPFYCSAHLFIGSLTVTDPV